MRRPFLRLGLWLADRILPALPRGAAYGLADLAGRLWYRMAPDRRAVVAANLARVCEATGRPTSGAAFRALVRQAFVEHARYYLDLVRAFHYPPDRVSEIASVDDWDEWVPRLRNGLVLATAHVGTFEPFGHLLEREGIHGVSPVEEIRPPELFAFLAARRAGGRTIEAVPLARARRRMLAELRAGGVAALVADRDLTGDGVPVTMFGHPTTLPSGPAALSLMTDRPMIVAIGLRTAPERFRAHVWPIDVERTGDRRADTVALTQALARCFEAAIAEAPEQWWGAFQPYWSDLRRGGEAA